MSTSSKKRTEMASGAEESLSPKKQPFSSNDVVDSSKRAKRKIVVEGEADEIVVKSAKKAVVKKVVEIEAAERSNISPENNLLRQKSVTISPDSDAMKTEVTG
jgi:hypothetical protein